MAKRTAFERGVDEGYRAVAAQVRRRRRLGEQAKAEILASRQFRLVTRVAHASGRKGALVARTEPMTFKQALQRQPKLQAKWDVNKIVVKIEEVQ